MEYIRDIKNIRPISHFICYFGCFQNIDEDNVNTRKRYFEEKDNKVKRKMVIKRCVMSMYYPFDFRTHDLITVISSEHS